MGTRMLWLLAGIAVFAGCGRMSEMGHARRTAEPNMALGWVDRSVLVSAEYGAFRVAYDSAQLRNEVVEMIRGLVEGVDFTVFFGTWCEDSHREVSRFLKVADAAGIARERIRLYGLDRSKKSDDGLTEQSSISLVPTIILMKNGSEIGRIVEKPQATVEEDILSILAAAWPPD
jgi:thiol-disulfide isomerase/thioredoxin